MKPARIISGKPDREVQVDEDVKVQDVEVIENEPDAVDDSIAEKGERISLTEEQGEEILREYFENTKKGIPKDVLDNMTPSILKKDEDKAKAPESTEKPEGADKVNAPADDDISKLTPEQIVKNYKELQKKLGEQGNELGELRKLKTAIATQGFNNNPTGQVNPIAHNIFQVNQPLPFTPPMQQQIPEPEFDFTNPKDVERVAINAIENRIKQMKVQQDYQKSLSQVQSFNNAYAQGIQDLVNQGVPPEEAQKAFADHFNEFMTDPVKTAYKTKTHQQEILEAEKRGEQRAIEKMQNATKVNPKRAANITSATTNQGDTDFKNMSPADLQTYMRGLNPESKEYEAVERHILSMAKKEK